MAAQMAQQASLDGIGNEESEGRVVGEEGGRGGYRHLGRRGDVRPAAPGV